MKISVLAKRSPDLNMYFRISTGSRLLSLRFQVKHLGVLQHRKCYPSWIKRDKAHFLLSTMVAMAF